MLKEDGIQERMFFADPSGAPSGFRCLLLPACTSASEDPELSGQRSLLEENKSPMLLFLAGDLSFNDLLASLFPTQTHQQDVLQYAACHLFQRHRARMQVHQMGRPSVTNYCVFAFNYYHLLPEERQQRISDGGEDVDSREGFPGTWLGAAESFPSRGQCVCRGVNTPHTHLTEGLASLSSLMFNETNFNTYL